MNMTYLIIGGIVVVIGWLAYTGTLSKLLGLGKVKTQDAVNQASTGVEKKKMRINALKPLLESLGQQMTDLDGKFGAANGALTRAQAKYDAEVASLKNIVAAIADANNMTADESATRQKHLDAVREAKALVDAKKTEIQGIAAQAQTLHSQYADKDAELNKLKLEIPAAEARQIVINSKATAVDFAKKMAAFDEAAKMGADADTQMDEAEAKIDAELKRAGGVKSDTERKAEQKTRAQDDEALLKELGIGGPDKK